MGQKINQKGNQKVCWDKQKHDTSKLMEWSKNSTKREVYSHEYDIKKEWISNTDLNFTLQETRKE